MTKMIVPPLQLLFHQRPLLPPLLLKKSAAPQTAKSPASTLPGDSDMASGNISMDISDSSNIVTDNVRVQVSSTYRPERSDENP